MYFNISSDDIWEAEKAISIVRRSHAWLNPIVKAVERRFPGSAVIVGEAIHVAGNGLIGRFPLTDVALNYLQVWREGRRVFPVERLHLFKMESLRRTSDA